MSRSNTLEFTEIHTKTKRENLNVEMAKVASEIHLRFKKTGKLVSCPCCKSDQIESYTIKFGFALDRCRSCFHVFTNPFPSDEALNYYYNSSFKTFENQFFIDTFERRMPIFKRRIEFMQHLGVGKRVVDIGSAVGIFLEANNRSAESFDITACDLSEESCNYLRSRFPNIIVLHRDVNELPPGDFDCVTLWDTFEHIPYPDLMLASVSGQLSDDGYFIFSTPNTNSFEWQVMGDSHVQLLPPGHVNLYNTENIKKILERNNFIVETIETMNPSLDLTYVRSALESVPDSISRRAALASLDLILHDSVIADVEKRIRSLRYAGNMLVVARKV